MTKSGTILKTMQTVLLVTVLTPAIGHADSLSTRQMLAQAQTQSQDQAVKGEVKKINRGLIVGTAQAAPNSNAQRPVEIPAIAAPVTAAKAPAVAAVDAPQIEIPALPPRNDDVPANKATTYSPATAATPTAATSTSSPSVVTQPAPQAVPTTSTTVATTPAATTSTAATTNVDTSKTNAAKVDATTAKMAQALQQRHAHGHGGSGFNMAGMNMGGMNMSALSGMKMGGMKMGSMSMSGMNMSSGNITGQIKKIMNRPEVKSMLAQYGLD